jgi:hypothetical protein
MNHTLEKLNRFLRCRAIGWLGGFACLLASISMLAISCPACQTSVKSGIYLTLAVSGVIWSFGVLALRAMALKFSSELMPELVHCAIFFAILVGSCVLAASVALGIKPCMLCSLFWLGVLAQALDGAFLVSTLSKWLLPVSAVACLLLTAVTSSRAVQQELAARLPDIGRSNSGLPVGSRWPLGGVSQDGTYLIATRCPACMEGSFMRAVAILTGRHQPFTILAVQGAVLPNPNVPTFMVSDHTIASIGLSPAGAPYHIVVRNARVVEFQSCEKVK